MYHEELMARRRAAYDEINGPGSWDRMMDERMKREAEVIRREEEERKRILEEREKQRIAWEKYQEEQQRRMYLYDHTMEVFLKEKQGFCFDRSGTIASQELYDIYDRWCAKQKVFPETPRIFLGWLKRNGAELCIRPCQNLLTPDGRRVRGFRGIRAAQEEDT